MPNINISPNMGMPVPVPGVDPGPDWANNIVSCLSIIDQHNHSLNKGVPVTPGGININANLPFNGNSASSLGGALFSPLGATLPSSTTGALYMAGSDLYFNDGSGNVVRMTQGGSVPGAAGTITGLPSGTASASFAAGTFTFLASTGNAAALAYGNSVQKASGNANTVTTQAPAALAASYALTWPGALPVGTNGTMQVSPTGTLSFTQTPVFDGVTISGLAFKTTKVNGTLSASGSASVGTFTTLISAFGITTNAGASLWRPMGNQATTNQVYFIWNSATGALSVFNTDSSNSNAYTIVIFYS